MMNDFYPVQQTAVAGTGAVNIIPASGVSNTYMDLISLIITTPNAAAGTLTISDRNKTVMVLNYPDSAAAPASPLALLLNYPIEQSGSGNAAWTVRHR